jgi:hypothetical protein
MARWPYRMRAMGIRDKPIAPAEFCEPTLAITTTSERTGHWTKMCRCLAPFSVPESSIHARSLAVFITSTCGFRFSVPTMVGVR